MHILRPHRTRRDDRGAAALEFALVFPIFALILFGLVSFGLLFAQDLAISNAARQAARFGAVPGQDCDAMKTEAINAAAPLVTLDATDIIIGPGCGSSTGEPCRETAVGSNVDVTITFTADVLLPVPGLGSTQELDGKGVFRCEFS
jgi:Flp pilus assembly protein TadG